MLHLKSFSSLIVCFPGIVSCVFVFLKIFIPLKGDFVMSRFPNNLTVISSSWAEEYRSLYQGLRLIEDC